MLCRAVTFMFAIAVTTMAVAAPIQFRLTMAGSTETPQHPLAGATLELLATLNHQTETRLVQKDDGISRNTVWSSFDSTAALKVVGSAASDGVYPGVVDASFTTGWHFVDSAAGDSLRFPAIVVEVNGNPIFFRDLIASFPESKLQGTGEILPMPFSESEASWLKPRIRSTLPGAEIQGLSMAGSATVIPEPTSTCLAFAALASSAHLRRRQQAARLSGKVLRRATLPHQ